MGNTATTPGAAASLARSVLDSTETAAPLKTFRKVRSTLTGRDFCFLLCWDVSVFDDQSLPHSLTLEGYKEEKKRLLNNGQERRELRVLGSNTHGLGADGAGLALARGCRGRGRELHNVAVLNNGGAAGSDLDDGLRLDGRRHGQSHDQK
ncbi:hypothetical protein BC828DRAFT_386792 [Blastocladiella britannica]|nr:hypothetical protein BC828DRAFT_386792 [Blastocladiella britannica]